jgi:hypothetical protein
MAHSARLRHPSNPIFFRLAADRFVPMALSRAMQEIFVSATLDLA